MGSKVELVLKLKVALKNEEHFLHIFYLAETHGTCKCSIANNTFLNTVYGTWSVGDYLSCAI